MEISSQPDIDSAFYLLVITYAGHGENEQDGQKETQNVQFEKKKQFDLT